MMYFLICFTLPNIEVIKGEKKRQNGNSIACNSGSCIRPSSLLLRPWSCLFEMELFPNFFLRQLLVVKIFLSSHFDYKSVYLFGPFFSFRANWPGLEQKVNAMTLHVCSELFWSLQCVSGVMIPEGLMELYFRNVCMAS